MAGIVEQVGADVKHLKVGQRVWTSKSLPWKKKHWHILISTTGTYYRDRRAGCFQHFVTVPHHTVLPIPGDMSYEEASCLGVAGLTAAMSLWHWLQVPGSPVEESQIVPSSGYFLVWGGSAVTGQFAIQLAALGGLRVIAVTSAKTADIARKLGASNVIIRDGKSGDQLVAEIKAIANDDITRAIDLVGPETANLCLRVLSKGQNSLFAPLAMMSSKAEVPQNVSVQTVEMKQFVLQESSRVYAEALNHLIEEQRIVLPQYKVLDGGLEKIVEGLDCIKQGDMGGKKLVVRISS
jgi:NADPH:quinone reductase-like Zn-dependent oxidoreductase